MAISLEALLASAQENKGKKRGRKASSSSKQQRAACKAAATIREEVIPPPLHEKLRTSRWCDVAVVMQVTHQRCECGASYDSVSPYAFVSRYHPQYGKHLQPLPHAAERQLQFRNLPRRCEYITQSITVCPECFSEESFAPDAQEQLDFGYEISVQATPEPEVPHDEIIYTPHYHLENWA